jgi:Universal stress protein family
VTALVVILAVALVVLVTVSLARERSHRSAKLATPSPGRVVFPFTGSALSQRGLDAALRLARVDGATLVPVFLVQVPLHLPLDAALPAACDGALPLLEAIEQRAARSGVAVDSRIERGRSYRHALRQMLEHEHFDTVVVTAADAGGRAGLAPDDISWLLENVPGEIIVIRPGTVDLQEFLLSAGPARQKFRQSRASRAEGAQARPRFLAQGARSHRS